REIRLGATLFAQARKRPAASGEFPAVHQVDIANLGQMKSRRYRIVDLRKGVIRRLADVRAEGSLRHGTEPVGAAFGSVWGHGPAARAGGEGPAVMAPADPRVVAAGVAGLLRLAAEDEDFLSGFGIQ